MAAHNDDIDELLDSALDDFQTLNLKPSSSKEDKSDERDQGKALPTHIQGLGLGLPDLKQKKRGKQKISASPKNAHVSETLDMLRQQTRETVRGLEATSGEAGDLNSENLEDWVKQFEQLSGSQDMESIVETMMQQLLSKEILYEPMKEIGERYPQWLEDHKSSLSEDDYNRYSYQHKLIQELKGVYETNPNNFTKIVELMQKMQECGHPPNDIVQELAPDFDLSQLGQLSPEMLEAQQNCSIM